MFEKVLQELEWSLDNREGAVMQYQGYLERHTTEVQKYKQLLQEDLHYIEELKKAIALLKGTK